MPFNHFDFLAGIYSRSGNISISETEARLFGLPAEGYLLDAGGGPGRIAEALQGQVKGVVVVDLSWRMLSTAVNRKLPSTCAPVENLPFADGIFDRVVVRDAFHHFKNQARAVQELWRVLAPGGRIIVIEPDILKASIKGLAVFEKIILMRSHFYRAEAIASFFGDPRARVTIIREALYAYTLVEKERRM